MCLASFGLTWHSMSQGQATSARAASDLDTGVCVGAAPARWARVHTEHLVAGQTHSTKQGSSERKVGGAGGEGRAPGGRAGRLRGEALSFPVKHSTRYQC